MLQLIKSCTLTALLVSFAFILHAQNLIKGTIKDSDGNPIDNATISVDGTKVAISTNSEGNFTIQLPSGKSKITARAVGYMPAKKDLANTIYQEGLEIILDSDNRNLEEVVVSGTLKQVSKLDSPIPVEVFTAKFFQSNPAPTIFESLQNINGVRPQINCSVCKRGISTSMV